MITHLLLWTNKNAKKLTGDLKSKVKKALEKSELWVLFTISALTVSRE
jgi:REP element-mobilizing transposase RayT